LELAQVQVAQKLADRLGAHPGLEAVAPLLAGFTILEFREHFALGERRVALVDDDIGSKIDDLLELSRRHVEEDADAARYAFEIPNVADGGRKFDVTHALATHFGARDLDAAAVADHPFKADALVFAAVAFPVFGGAEDLLAE